MKRTRRKSSKSLVIVLTTATVALSGVVANLVAATEGSTSERLTNYLSLTVAILALALGLLSIELNNRASERSANAVDSAQRQVEVLHTLAGRAGPEVERIYDEFLHNDDYPLGMRFIYAWSRLEREMRSIVLNKRGDDYAGRPLGILINEFVEIVGLAPEDKRRLRELLETRNMIVHGVHAKLDGYDLEKGLKELENYTYSARRDGK